MINSRPELIGYVDEIYIVPFKGMRLENITSAVVKKARIEKDREYAMVKKPLGDRLLDFP